MAADYKRLPIPTTIIAGAHDRYVSARAHSTRLHAEIPGSELVLVPGAGHMVQHVAPHALMHALLGVKAHA